MKYKYLLISVSMLFASCIRTMDYPRATATLEFGSARGMRDLENGDISFDIVPEQEDNTSQLKEISAPESVHQQLIDQRLCFKGANGKLYPNKNRFDFDQFVHIIQSFANIVTEMGAIKETLSGSSTALAEERNARTIAQAANERKFKIAKWTGAGAFVVTVTPSIIAIIKAFTS